MCAEKLKNYFYLMRFDKPIGIFLLLWPTLWGLWLAGEGKPDFFIVTIFVLGVIIMRAAGCVINDFADRHFDGQVARTRMRPLASGKMKSSDAFILFVFLCGIAFLLVLQLNIFTIYLAVIGALLATVYPFLKRFTHLPQLGLGLAFSWGIPMAFAAQENIIPTRSWVLFAAAVIWAVIYDTMYAMVDRADDVKVGIKSTAVLFGNDDRGIIAVLQFIFFVLLGLSGVLFQLYWPYFLSLLIVAGLLVYQQWLIKNHVHEKCFKAFLNNHWVGLIIFAGIILSYYL